MRLSLKSFYLLLIGVLFFATSCKKEEKIANKFSEQDVYSYVAFKPNSSWYLSNGTDTIEIKSDINEGFRPQEGKDKDRVELEAYYFGVIDSNHIDIALISKYEYDTKGTEMDLSVLINVIDNYHDNFFFNTKDTTVEPVNLQMYFEDITLQSGMDYVNCAVIYLNSNSSLEHFRKFYIAPEVGVVRIETNTGSIYELFKNESEMMSSEELEFADD